MYLQLESNLIFKWGSMMHNFDVSSGVLNKLSLLQSIKFSWRNLMFYEVHDNGLKNMNNSFKAEVLGLKNAMVLKYNTWLSKRY